MKIELPPDLAELYENGKSTDKMFLGNPSLIKQFIKTVIRLRSVDKVEQLLQYKGLGYEKLKDEWKGYSAVRINRQYRLIFEEIHSMEEPFHVALFKIEEVNKHYE